MTNPRERYDKLFIEKAILLEEKRIKKRSLAKIRRQTKTCQAASVILIEVSKAIQKQFKKRVETLITDAIQTVYKYPYTFELKFNHKRNNIETKPVIKKGATELIPKEDLGGGILDIISIGFKIILWYLQNPQTRPILFLDESFKFLGSYSNRAGHMLKYLSKSFNLQIIMTSHSKELIKFCKENK